MWNDANVNGVQDAGEGGVAAVTVILRNSASVVVGTTTTDSGGVYSFTNLSPGTYTVSITVPSGYALTASKAGSDTTADSDLSTSTGSTDPITLTAGQTLLFVDAGLVQLGE